MEPELNIENSSSELVEIWDEYSDQIYRYFYSQLKNEELAKDLTQDIFLKLIQNESKLSEIKNFNSWLFRVAKNRLIDHTRKKSESRLPEGQLVFKQDSDKMSELIDSIHECLEELVAEYDPAHTDLFLDIFSGEISQKEAARKLNLPYSTLKSRVQTARKHVKKQFTERCCVLLYNSEGRVINCEPVHTENPNNTDQQV